MLAVETLFDPLLYAASTTLAEARRMYDAGVISDDTFTRALDAYTFLRGQVPTGYVIPAECREPAPTLLELFSRPVEPPAEQPSNVVVLADFRKRH